MCKLQMNNKKLLSIIIFTGLLSTSLDIATKLVAYTLFPNNIVFNSAFGGNYLFSIKYSYLFSLLSFIAGISTLLIGKTRLNERSLRIFAIGLGFILGALIQMLEALAFPIVDFIPVHSYLLFDFIQGARWGLANFADFYKPLGITLMSIGTLSFIKEAMPQSFTVKSTAF